MVQMHPIAGGEEFSKDHALLILRLVRLRSYKLNV